jgi:hypothetical protein
MGVTKNASSVNSRRSEGNNRHSGVLKTGAAVGTEKEFSNSSRRGL